jgi:inositol phosphorylceramide synthase catalytic subunit
MKYMFSFGLVCFMSVGLQYLMPTPPPWLLVNPPLPQEAYFYRTDKLTGIPIFHSIYSRSPLVCGAFPSLHSAWPVLILVIKPWISRSFCLFHCFATAFAAVYSWHHFIIDIIFGWFFAVISVVIGSFIIENFVIRLNVIPYSKLVGQKSDDDEYYNGHNGDNTIVESIEIDSSIV